MDRVSGGSAEEAALASFFPYFSKVQVEKQSEVITSGEISRYEAEKLYKSEKRKTLSNSSRFFSRKYSGKNRRYLRHYWKAEEILFVQK